MTDATLKTNLQTLYDSGYVDFEENKIMIESNPAMSMVDIMACIDESKREEGTNLEDVEAEESSDAAGDGLEESDVEEMQSFAPEPNVEHDDEIEAPADSGSENDSEEKPAESEEQKQGEEKAEAPKAEEPASSKVEAAPQVGSPHDDPNLYVVTKR